MHFSRATIIALAAALALGGCDRPTPEQDPAAEAPQQAPAAARDSTPAPALPPSATVPPNARRSTAPEPTREDSIAAAREDVTPEWKQRERSMDTYANCMEQARAVTGPARQQLEKACGNLPTAPK